MAMILVLVCSFTMLTACGNCDIQEKLTEIQQSFTQLASDVAGITQLFVEAIGEGIDLSTITDQLSGLRSAIEALTNLVNLIPGVGGIL